MRKFCMLSIVFVMAASAAIIDVPPPGSASSPWHSLAGDPVVTFAFKTSHDGIAWTSEEQAVVYDILALLDESLPNQTFVESGDFTLRWAGADFFKDWRGPGFEGEGWDLSLPLAVAYKHDNGPWKDLPGNPFPNNEIYFNRAYPWSFDLLGPPADKYDFWTVALHESIHMLACDVHAEDADEVMFETVGLGVRKYPKLSDVQILINAGYTVDPARLTGIPEPGSLALVAGGVILIYIRLRSRRRTVAR